MCVLFVVFFFFQAEDGIRDADVTGVQTCALPISSRALAFTFSVGSVEPKIVWVLPSTRTCTRAARAAGTSTSKATTTANRLKERRYTNPPSARGSVLANGRSSDSGLPLPPPSRLSPVALGGRASPLTAAGPSRTCTGFPYRSPFDRDYHPSVLASRLSAWLPVLAWAAVIFALSSIPHLGTGLGTWDTILRKGAHVTEYAIFGLLL